MYTLTCKFDQEESDDGVHGQNGPAAAEIVVK